MQKKVEILHLYSFFCGERGIRTPGASQLNGFQDRRNRPLCHLSNALKTRVFQNRLQRYNKFWIYANFFAKKWLNACNLVFY